MDRRVLFLVSVAVLFVANVVVATLLASSPAFPAPDPVADAVGLALLVPPFVLYIISRTDDFDFEGYLEAGWGRLLTDGLLVAATAAAVGGALVYPTVGLLPPLVTAGIGLLATLFGGLIAFVVRNRSFAIPASDSR